MSELPTILVTNGWKTDKNRKLTSVTIPSTVKTLQAPTKVTFMGARLNVVPSTTAALQEFEAPNCTLLGANIFKGYTALTNVVLGSVGHAVTSLDSTAFTNCTQSGLTITIYTTGGASLSGEKWGATNATIVYETA